MDRRLEWFITMLIGIVGVIGCWSALQIGGFAFDPLGSRAVPLGVSVLMIGLCVVQAGKWLLIRAPVASATGAPVDVEKTDLNEDGLTKDGESEDDIFEAQQLLAPLGMLALCLGFIWLVFLERFPLSLVTIAFVVVAAQLLPMPNRRRCTLIALMLGVVLGFGAEWLFTQVFFVDLPALG